MSLQYIELDDEITDPALQLGRNGDGAGPEEPDRIIGYREGLLIAERLREERISTHLWEREAVPFRLPGAVESRMAHYGGKNG